MIAPLEFIFGGGNDIEPIKMSGGAIETFSKKCDEIKDKYGVPIGYSCIYTHTRALEPEFRAPDLEKDNYITDISAETEDAKEIDDEMFDTLFAKASEGRAPKKNTRRRVTTTTAQPRRRTRRHRVRVV